jgi:hypothetical protein
MFEQLCKRYHIVLPDPPRGVEIHLNPTGLFTGQTIPSVNKIACLVDTLGYTMVYTDPVRLPK